MPAELLREVVYDAQDRVIAVYQYSPSCATTTFCYDEAGNLIAEDDAADGSCLTYTYEADDILTVEDDLAANEQDEDDEELEYDGPAEAGEMEENGPGTGTADGQITS